MTTLKFPDATEMDVACEHVKDLVASLAKMLSLFLSVCAAARKHGMLICDADRLRLAKDLGKIIAVESLARSFLRARSCR